VKAHRRTILVLFTLVAVTLGLSVSASTAQASTPSLCQLLHLCPSPTATPTSTTTASAPAPSASSSTVAGSNNLPVLYVHGYIDTTSVGCSGGDTNKGAAPLAQVLAAEGYTGPVLGVAYYCLDTGSLVIRNAGDGHCDDLSKQGYTSNTPIERLGCDLAWSIYNTYSANGQYVSVVGHSMGGLITAWALTHVGQNEYPPYLLVSNAVTVSSPLDGSYQRGSIQYSNVYVTSWCGVYNECTEMINGSKFLTALHQGVLPSSVIFTTIGGGSKDTVDTYESSSAIAAQHKVDMNATAPVAYSHTTYMTDTSLAMDEPQYETDTSGTTYDANGPHSLGRIAVALTATS